ncbi:MAG: hypothetical protein CM15mV88_210 [Caudoviricetes sp.]|nr:MAG: hypothetical protein CM15mV88_210 [Caudoviricetes sp.]
MNTSNKKNGYKYKDIKKYLCIATIQNKNNTVARLDTGEVFYSGQLKEASIAYIAGKISQDEVETLTNKYFI